MGQYLRYVSTDPRPLDVDLLERALPDVDSGYQVRQPEMASNTLSDLFVDGVLYGQIEVSLPGDDLFDRTVAELERHLPEAEPSAQPQVRDTLRHATATVTLELLRHSDPARAQALWRWLATHHPGLLHTPDRGWHRP